MQPHDVVKHDPISHSGREIFAIGTDKRPVDFQAVANTRISVSADLHHVDVAFMHVRYPCEGQVCTT